MNLSVLEDIKKRYEDFVDMVNSYRKGKLGILSEEEVKAVKDTVEDLFVLEIFSCFERFLRDKIRDCLNLKACPFGKQTVINHIEYLKIDDILESLKKEAVVDADSLGYIKQLKRYRDWIAHGRNPRKPPPIRTVDFDKAFEIIESTMRQVEAKLKENLFKRI